jgi:nucleoside phosphorylase
MLAIFTGVRREHDAIDRNLTTIDRHQTEDGYFITMGEYAGKPIVVCRTNLGEDRVKGIVDRVLDQYPISSVVSAHMAPSISEELNIGDLIICQRIFLYRDPGVLTEPSGQANLRLMELAGRAAKSTGLEYLVGDCITHAPLKSPVQPAVFKDGPGVQIIDSEGYWLAETAFKHELPFLAVRTCLGDALRAMPEALSMVGSGAYVPVRRIATYAITHPAKVPNMIRLKRAVDRACGSLDLFFAAFLRELAEQPAPTRSR